MKKVLAVLLFFVVVGCPVFALPQSSAPGSPAGLANPASVFCVQCGGTVSIQSTPAGEVGICTWLNGLQIEEWSLWRFFHPDPAPVPY